MPSITQERQADHTADQAVRTGWEQLQQEISLDDAELTARMHALGRNEARHAAAIFFLLVLSIVLLAIGLGTQSATALFAGGAAFLASFGVDHRYRRRPT